MLGFLKVVPEPITVPQKLSDALLLGSEKYPQSVGHFQEEDKMCALMVAYTVAYGKPEWMSVEEPAFLKSVMNKGWADKNGWQKTGIVFRTIPFVLEGLSKLVFFHTRLKLRYGIPISEQFTVMGRNDSGKSFYNIAYDLKSKGY